MSHTHFSILTYNNLQQKNDSVEYNTWISTDSKLDSSKNHVQERSSRLYFHWKLRSFNIGKTVLQMFYCSVVVNIIFYAVMSWGSRLNNQKSWICTGS